MVPKLPQDVRASLINDRISPFLREAHQKLLDAAKLKAQSRILLLECRDGWAAEEAWRKVGSRAYVYGVDVSPSMIEIARQYREVQGRLEISSWDLRRLPVAQEVFDVVLIPFSLHRFSQPSAVLKEVARS